MICLDPTGAKRFEEENLRLQEYGTGEPRIVLFGDSRIAYWNPLPSLPGCQLLNRGIAGQTTAQAILRLDKDIIQVQPSVVTIQLGINDLTNIAVFPKSKEEIISMCWENLSVLVKRTTEHDIHVVILTIFPPGRVDLFRGLMWSDEIDNAVQRVNKLVHKLEGSKVTVVDCDIILSDGKSLKGKYAKDTLHLTQTAYQALNTFLTPLLAELAQNKKKAEN